MEFHGVLMVVVILPQKKVVMVLMVYLMMLNIKIVMSVWKRKLIVNIGNLL